MIRRPIFFKRIFRTGYIPNTFDWQDICDSYINKRITKPQAIYHDVNASGRQVASNTLSTNNTFGGGGIWANVISAANVSCNSTTSAAFLSLNVAANLSPSSGTGTAITRSISRITSAATSSQSNVNISRVDIGREIILFNRNNYIVSVNPDTDLQFNSQASGAAFLMSAATKYGFVQVTTAQMLVRDYN